MNETQCWILVACAVAWTAKELTMRWAMHRMELAEKSLIEARLYNARESINLREFYKNIYGERAMKPEPAKETLE